MKRMIYFLPAIAALNFHRAGRLPLTNAMNTNETNKIEIADLGGGCFWCMEAVFERLPGVISVTSGFAGGSTPNPTYEQVCTETTGHAEVTQIEFDPAKISYAKLLDVFWQAHDPTTLNRQGADVGTSYRSIILYRNEEQKLMAGEIQGRGAEEFQASHRHRNRAAHKILQGRELSPAIFRQQFERALLPDGHRAQAAQAGEGKGDSDHAANRKMNRGLHGFHGLLFISAPSTVFPFLSFTTRFHSSLALLKLRSSATSKPVMFR